MEKAIMAFIKLSIMSLFMLGLVACLGDASSLKVGMKAPSVQTKTLQDVNHNLSKITTYRYPDERMYLSSIDDALTQGKPIVLEFATPAHCTQCDKQLQMLKALLNKYEDDVIFLHMDQYENPEAYRAFSVLGDPWTFVIDRQQIVRYKQAGRMLYNELDALIKIVLEPETTIASSASSAG